jgi:hypothetical protein
MSPDDAQLADLQARLLPELAELGAAVARKMAARIDKAQDDAAAATLASAFERASRSVRMCLALMARLAADRRRLAREDAEAGRLVLEHRRKQIRTVLGRIIEQTAEPRAVPHLTQELRERLEEEKLFETFADGPVEAHIARIRKLLDLPEAEADAPKAEAPGAAIPTPAVAKAGTQAEPGSPPRLRLATPAPQPP